MLNSMQPALPGDALFFRLIYPFSLLTPFYSKSLEQGPSQRIHYTLPLPPLTRVISFAWNNYLSPAFSNIKVLSLFHSIR